MVWFRCVRESMSRVAVIVSPVAETQPYAHQRTILPQRARALLISRREPAVLDAPPEARERRQVVLVETGRVERDEHVGPP